MIDRRREIDESLETDDLHRGLWNFWKKKNLKIVVFLSATILYLFIYHLLEITLVGQGHNDRVTE